MKPIRSLAVLAFSVVLSAACARSATSSSGEYFVYFGTYTGFTYMKEGLPAGTSHSKGIYVSRFQPATGVVSTPEVAAEIVNPAFLAVHPNHKFLYVATEDPLSLGPDFDHESFVSAFAIDPNNGQLRLLNTLPTGGTSTCYLSIDKTGRYVMMANFGSSSVTVLRIKDDGSLGEQAAFMKHIGHGRDPSFQSQAHPHSIDVSPDNKYAIVSDLGVDKVFVYKFDAATGALSPDEAPSVEMEEGGGPRHFVFDARGKFGYSLKEMSGFVTVLAWDPANGTLSNIQDARTLEPNFVGGSDSAEIAIHPNGKFLYESNRRFRGPDLWGPDTIGVFAIDPEKGTLSAVEQVAPGGTMPRNFAIDPTGSYLFSGNEYSGNVALFRINGDTGKLTPTKTDLKIDAPVSIVFVPAEK
ncbi:MAG TPA: lactonase family protein [Terriglobales bacterium]|jgi:6-phosphogluconolactonase|nr:lactonase family protein [Terriglobales bacterium]